MKEKKYINWVLKTNVNLDPGTMLMKIWKMI